MYIGYVALANSSKIRLVWFFVLFFKDRFSVSQSWNSRPGCLEFRDPPASPSLNGGIKGVCPSLGLFGCL